MGVSAQSVRTYARSLEKKKYLQREPRIGMSNKFHIHGLIAALNAIALELGKAQEKEPNPFSDAPAQSTLLPPR